MKKPIILLISLLTLVSTLNAEPLRWGVIINAEEKLCSNYWEGDECIVYTPDAGWIAHFPSYDSTSKKSYIRYSDKKCVFGEANVKKTCECLGFNFKKDTGAVSKKTDFADEPGSTCSTVSK